MPPSEVAQAPQAGHTETVILLSSSCQQMLTLGHDPWFPSFLPSHQIQPDSSANPVISPCKVCISNPTTALHVHCDHSGPGHHLLLPHTALVWFVSLISLLSRLCSFPTVARGVFFNFSYNLNRSLVSVARIKFTLFGMVRLTPFSCPLMDGLCPGLLLVTGTSSLLTRCSSVWDVFFFFLSYHHPHLSPHMEGTVLEKAQ